ncbi:MAG: hypothetical protein WCD54_29780, partial [Pseudolabrys sp.]
AEVFFAIDHQSGRLGALRRCYSMIHYSRAWKTSPRRVEQNLRQIEALVRAGGSVGRGRSFLSELSRGEPTSNLDNNTLRNLIYLLLIASTDVTGLMHWVILTPTASSASALRRAVNTLLWACPGSPASASS